MPKHIQPVRIQLSRKAGFDLQKTSLGLNNLPCVVVARPSKWGNPFIVGQHGTREYCVRLFILLCGGYLALGCDSVCFRRQQRFLAFKRDNLESLQGKNLACWCRGKPCHADVLIAISNLENAGSEKV